MALGHNTVRNRHPAGAADALESSCEPDVIIESFLPPESALKKEAEIWHEMTVIEEMMPVYLEYGLK